MIYKYAKIKSLKEETLLWNVQACLEQLMRLNSANNSLNEIRVTLNKWYETLSDEEKLLIELFE